MLYAGLLFQMLLFLSRKRHSWHPTKPDKPFWLQRYHGNYDWRNIIKLSVMSDGVQPYQEQNLKHESYFVAFQLTGMRSNLHDCDQPSIDWRNSDETIFIIWLSSKRASTTYIIGSIIKMFLTLEDFSLHSAKICLPIIVLALSELKQYASEKRIHMCLLPNNWFWCWWYLLNWDIYTSVIMSGIHITVIVSVAIQDKQRDDV